MNTMNIHDFLKNVETRNSVDIRSSVKEAYPHLITIVGFRNWLECTWCSYDGYPDWKDMESLRESLEVAEEQWKTIHI